MTGTAPIPSKRTAVLVDLARFTIATSTHGDETAADLAERVCELTTISLGDGDQLVQGIGDVVMLVSRSSNDALVPAGRICHLPDYEAAFPLLRIGIPRAGRGDRPDRVWASRAQRQGTSAQVGAAASTGGVVSAPDRRKRGPSAMTSISAPLWITTTRPRSSAHVADTGTFWVTIRRARRAWSMTAGRWAR